MTSRLMLYIMLQRQPKIDKICARCAMRHRRNSSPCGQSPMDFYSISLATRTQCLAACHSRLPPKLLSCLHVFAAIVFVGSGEQCFKSACLPASGGAWIIVCQHRATCAAMSLQTKCLIWESLPILIGMGEGGGLGAQGPASAL